MYCLAFICTGAVACAKSGPQSQPDRSPETSTSQNVTQAPSINAVACEELPAFTPATSFSGPVVPGQVIPIGAAVDPVTGNAYDGVLCVEVDHSITASEQTKSELAVRFAPGQEQLAGQLDIPPSAAFKIGLWRADSTAKFLHDQRFAPGAVFAVVHQSVRTQVTGPRVTGLKDFARQMLQAGDYARFIRRCGSGFVSAIEKGGDFYIVVEFVETNSEQRTDIEYILTAPSGGGVEDQLDRVRELMGNHRHKIHVLRQGGAGNLEALSFDSLVDLAKQLPQTLERAPRIRRFLASPYQVVEAFPSQIIDRYNSAYTTLSQLGSRYLAAAGREQVLATYTSVLGVLAPDYGRFPAGSEAACAEAKTMVADARRAAHEEVVALEKAARSCINDRSADTCFSSDACQVPPPVPTDMPELPPSCQRSCGFDAGTIIEPLKSEPVTTKVSCKGLIPESDYVAELTVGEVVVTRTCTDAKGKPMPIEVSGGFGSNDEAFAVKAGNTVLPIAPMPYEFTVPGTGNVEIPLTLRNAVGDKGCVYKVNGKVSIRPK